MNFLNNKKNETTTKPAASIEIENNANHSFKLKSSGRVIRSIKNAPTNVEDRDWIVPDDTNSNKSSEVTTSREENTQDNHDVDFDPTRDKMRYMAEIFHIIRPMCHLSCIFMFKSKSWIQFVVPLTLDTLSLFMMKGTKDLSDSQKKEMRRRSILVLHYLIRSPFYDHFSCSIINLILCQFEQRIPGMKYITKPINDYIPYWRSIYNYCWTT
jgi:peroxin-16